MSGLVLDRETTLPRPSPGASPGAALKDGPDVGPSLPPGPRRRRNFKQVGAAALAIAALIGVGDYGTEWWNHGRFVQSTDDAYVGGDVTQIAPHVGGFIQQILVTDHQFVTSGQSLVRLDRNDFAAALSHAEAVLTSRQAALASLRAKRALQDDLIAGAAADIAAKQAQATFASQDAERYRSLALTPAGTRQAEQKTSAGERAATAAVLSARSAFDAARQQAEVLDADIAAAQADVGQAEADLRTAQLNIGYTDVTSPVSGYVGNRSAQVGAYVATGTDLLSVVPAHGLWVDANFKEDQVAFMKPGAAASIVADVLPGQVFHGHVESLSPATGATFSVIPPQNATGNFTKIVQRIPVRIALDGEAQNLGLLRAGLSTTVSVDTKAAVEQSK